MLNSDGCTRQNAWAIFRKHAAGLQEAIGNWKRALIDRKRTYEINYKKLVVVVLPVLESRFDVVPRSGVTQQGAEVLSWLLIEGCNTNELNDALPVHTVFQACLANEGK